jgi:hypothetical protein
MFSAARLATVLETGGAGARARVAAAAEAVDLSGDFGEQQRRRARIGAGQVSPSVLQREQPVGEWQQSRRLGALRVLPRQQVHLMLQVIGEQDVIELALATQPVEDELPQLGLPSGIELAHAPALIRRRRRIVAAPDRGEVGVEAVHDRCELAFRAADESLDIRGGRGGALPRETGRAQQDSGECRANTSIHHAVSPRGSKKSSIEVPG